MRRPARAWVDPAALRHNLAVARRHAPHSRIVAMVKANAYGHGLENVAAVLADRVDAFGVACVPEALALREAGIDGRILVTQGFHTEAELHDAARFHLDVVVHADWQLRALENASLHALPKLWVKVDSGMHRLGFSSEQVPLIHASLSRLSGLKTPPGLLTHFACADQPENSYTSLQIQRFDRATQALRGERSLCNSAAVFTRRDAHRDWIRPGIMLYGASPLQGRPADALDLRPAMHLRAPLIAINHRRRGDAIGYGGLWTCPQDMPVGVVAAGYGDGYPRHAPSGAPVALRGRVAALIGRVSMDMLTIDLRGIDARVGDEVELWGGAVPVDEVARQAGTIAYELLCQVGGRCLR